MHEFTLSNRFGEGSASMKTVTLDPDPNWAKIPIQIQLIWIHNTGPK